MIRFGHATLPHFRVAKHLVCTSRGCVARFANKHSVSPNGVIEWRGLDLGLHQRRRINLLVPAIFDSKPVEGCEQMQRCSLKRGDSHS